MKRPSMRDIIADTMMELLEHERIEDITVAAVSEEIGISSRTFYNHFKDKFDVCNYLYDRIVDNECWYMDGKRVNLAQYLENVGRMLDETYPQIFENLLYYQGQNCLRDHIYARGVEDLKEQLVYTGHEEMLTPEYILQMQFYTRALVSSLLAAMENKNQHHYLMIQDKTKYLPKDLYDALTAEPIYARAPEHKASQ